jgi:A/G-specific adenine glycosylase
VARVLRRVFHSRATSKAWARRLERSAAMLLPRGGRKAWLFNQAIMELGALICTARVPRCGTCPVRAVCQTAVREAGRTRAASLRQRAQPARRSPQSRRQSAGGLAAHRSSGPPRR